MTEPDLDLSPEPNPDVPSQPDPPVPPQIDWSDHFCRGLSAAAGGAFLCGTIVPAMGGPVAVGIGVGIVLGLVWVWLFPVREAAADNLPADASEPPPKS